jgi:hypothetical protein
LSVFQCIPSEFPFDVDLSNLPVSYQLKRSLGDSIVVIVMCIIWIFTIPYFSYLIADAIAEVVLSELLSEYFALLFSFASFIWATFFYFGLEILDLLKKVEIEISKTNVTVKEKRLFLSSGWSAPLNSFEGVAILDLGIQTTPDDKRMHVSSIILKHPNSSKSIPILFRNKKNVGLATVKKVSTSLGSLPIIEKKIELNAQSPLSDEVIVHGGFQSYKVYLIYAILMILGVAGTAYGSYLFPQQEQLTDIVAITVMLVFSIFVTVGINIYVNRYITKLRIVDNAIEITTASPFFSRRLVNRDQVLSLSSRDWKMTTTRLLGNLYLKNQVDTPVKLLKLMGDKIPYIIDMQSESIARDKLSSLAENK